MNQYRELKNYKYQLTEDFEFKIGICPDQEIKTEFIDLDSYGKLIIKKGYSWDGASGPTWGDDKNIIPSLIHDAGYQLIREKYLGIGYRQLVDYVFYQELIKAGMSKFRAWYYWKAVRVFGEKHAKPK